MYDWLIVGAGLCGATFARRVADAGLRALVVDKRPHVAGDCYTEVRGVVVVHVYGPHVFHTDDAAVWAFVNRFARFTPYVHRVRVRARGAWWSYPINLGTLSRLGLAHSPAEATAYYKEQGLKQLAPIFLDGYSAKMWGRSWEEVAPYLIYRAPARTDFDDRYFTDRFQGIPAGGYTPMVEAMLDGVEVRLGVDFCHERTVLEGLARRILYTGRLDEFCGGVLGLLPYRTVRFLTLDCPGDVLGVAVANFPDADVPYVRATQHARLSDRPCMDGGPVTYESPMECGADQLPHYPVPTTAATAIHEQYCQLTQRTPNFHFAGRQAAYRALNMDQTVKAALEVDP